MTRNILFQNKSYPMTIAGNQRSKCDIIYKNWITLKRVMIFFTPWQELTIPILEPGIHMYMPGSKERVVNYCQNLNFQKS